jgi:hypothetical protein
MMKIDDLSLASHSRRLLTAVALLIAAPLLHAQFNTSNHVTSTPDSVQIGATLPVQGQLHVFSATNPTVLALYSMNSLTNAVKFQDMQPYDGTMYGLLADFQGNSAIKIGNMRIGYQGYPLITSLGGSTLMLNSMGVLGFSPGDVMVGGYGLGNGLRVEGGGNSSILGSVGIGIRDPAAKLHVVGDARLDGNLTVSGSIVSSSQSQTSFAGGVSIATTAQRALNVAGNASGSTGTVMQIAGTAPAGIYQNQLNITSAANTWGLIMGQNNNVSPNGYHCAGCAHIVNFNNAALVFGTNNTDRMRIDGAGHVGIGLANPLYALDVAGDAHFSGTVTGGNIQATYQDVAEWVPVSEQMAAGTVVVVSGVTKNTVGPSRSAYDTRVAGVVSAQPGVILGEASATKAKIATTGRVKVHVDATRQPIAMGDLLVTSDRPGMAMKSEPLDLGGAKIHRPGTLIGKALEPLAGGEGEILVLLSLQ